MIVEIREPEDMPRWPDGTAADLVMDNDSNIKRMNLGGLFEQATNAFGEQITQSIRTLVASEADRGVAYQKAYDVLLEYYSIASPLMYQYVQRKLVTPQHRNNHVDAVLKDGIYLWLPPHTPDIGAELISRLHKRYGLRRYPVTYKNSVGGFSTTKQSVLIGETYIVMLEKNGMGWSSVASPKRQHFGILARMTNADKHSAPGRENAVRITGEAEIRLMLALLPDYVVADLLDRPNNPSAHKQEVRSILQAENPAQIERAVDRNKIPLGGNRAIQFIRHVMWCCGVALKRAIGGTK